MSAKKGWTFALILGGLLLVGHFLKEWKPTVQVDISPKLPRIEPLLRKIPLLQFDQEG